MVLTEPQPQQAERLLTTREVAERCRVSTKTVCSWIKPGVMKNGVLVHLSGEMIGGHYRVSEAALAEFRRLCNPETWRATAEEQERERAQAKRDVKRVKQKLGVE